MADSLFIFEATRDNFDELVIHRSQETLVLVDFWAAWCQPCQMLMPVLAKMAEESQGAFILVKVNSDENQELSAQYGVRSLPTVKFFKAGEVVDEFMGVQPESAIQKLIDKHRVRQGEAKLQQARVLKQQNQLEAAEKLLRGVLDSEPDFHDAALELVEVLLLSGKTDDAETQLSLIPAGAVDQDRLETLEKQLQRSRMQTQVGDIEALQKVHDKNPDDLQIMLDLAKAKVVTGEVQEGLGLYLDVMKKDRSFGDDAARKGLLESFDLFDKNDPLIKEYRAKLYSMLY